MKKNKKSPKESAVKKFVVKEFKLKEMEMEETEWDDMGLEDEPVPKSMKWLVIAGSVVQCLVLVVSTIKTFW